MRVCTPHVCRAHAQAWAHDVAGLELVLNIHDQCGIDKCQVNYAAAAAAVGLDPSSGAPVECQWTSKAYAIAQYEYVLEDGDNVREGRACTAVAGLTRCCCAVVAAAVPPAACCCVRILGGR